ncbi:MAG: response regulator, partial [Candidatus Tectomicrobia bacterium]|nr:response regulator [Candidatus Tectomicrobia bacterium]
MNAKVLVVDDEAEMTTLLRTYLIHEGYEVDTASSAEAALTFLEDQDVDVVLTDLRMGEMSGLDLVRAIETTRPESRVILMTAFGDVETAIAAIKAGAFYFVTKPVKLPEVEVLLRQALTERDLNRENRQLRQ